MPTKGGNRNIMTPQTHCVIHNNTQIRIHTMNDTSHTLDNTIDMTQDIYIVYIYNVNVFFVHDMQ